jgi:hypothetical protein
MVQIILLFTCTRGFAIRGSGGKTAIAGPGIHRLPIKKSGSGTLRGAYPESQRIQARMVASRGCFYPQEKRINTVYPYPGKGRLLDRYGIKADRII